MQNLLPLTVLITELELRPGETLQPFLSNDSLSTRVFSVTSENRLFCCDLSHKNVATHVDLEELLAPDSEITGVQFIPDLESVCVTSSKGDILQYNVKSTEIESVGEIDSGISAMKWSPDYELVVFCTASRTLVMMTNDWEPVTEVSIFQDLDEHNDSSRELKKVPVTIDWRGDGKFFVINTTHPQTKHPVLKVFDRACNYISTSEETQGMIGCVSWRPSGDILASVQDLNNKLSVVFFEKNGLRHYDFGIRDDVQVTSLDWSPSSEVLSILVQYNSEQTEKQITAIQLWTRSNYYWYLKQELRFGAKLSEQEVVASYWGEESSDLFVCLRGGQVLSYRFIWDTYSSERLSPNDQKLVIVLDGKKLHLTPFRRLAPPPPMAASIIHLDSICNSIAFSSSGKICAFLSDDRIAIFDSVQLPSCPSQSRIPPDFSVPPKLLGLIDMRKMSLRHFRHPVWIEQDSTIFVLNSQGGSCPDQPHINQLVKIILGEEEKEKEATMTEPYSVATYRLSPVDPFRLYHNPNSDSVFLQSLKGEVYRVEWKRNQAVPSLQLFDRFPFPCFKFQSVVFGENKPVQSSGVGADGTAEEVIVGLSEKSNRLFVKGIECSSECNSFAIHNEYILFTTLSHTLRFISHSQPFCRELLDSNPTHAHDTCIREVERGARLVCVVSHQSRVVLQMPRGNLEIIYPRALQLSLCRVMLDSQQYADAFTEMRKHRIDLNLFHDHNPSDFFSNVKEFLQQIEKPSFINLFLSSIHEQDVTKILFPRREEKLQQSILPRYLIDLQRDQMEGGKVTRICSAIRSVLEEINHNDRYTLCIITSYMCSNPPKIEEALSMIKNIRQKELRFTNTQSSSLSSSAVEEGSKSTFRITSDAAIDYAIFLVDVDKLYSIALGMYDFDLAVMIAQKSSKDPKEYIPFLSAIKQLQPEAFQKYRIDLYLENWNKALKNLSESGAEHFETCVELIKSKSLFKLGLDIFDVGDDELDMTRKSNSARVWEIYGDSLLEYGEFEDAGRAFLKANKLEKSFSAFKSTTNNWQMLVIIARKLGWTSEQISQLGRELSSSFINLAKFTEAAQILQELCQDYQEAISALVRGCNWLDAIHLCYLHNFENLIDSLIRPALLESLEHHLDMIEERTKLFEKYFGRVQIVKTNNILFPRLVPVTAESDVSGIFSDASSMASSASGSYTMVSTVSAGGTRRKKKKKKKRVTGKEGSPYEEEFLINGMKELVPSKIYSEEVKGLLVALVDLGHRKEAQQLQDMQSSFINMVAKADDLITAPIIGVGNDDEDEDKTKDAKPTILKIKDADWKLACLF